MLWCSKRFNYLFRRRGEEKKQNKTKCVTQITTPLTQIIYIKYMEKGSVFQYLSKSAVPKVTAANMIMSSAFQ